MSIVSTYLTEYTQTWYRERPHLGAYGAPWTDFAAAIHTEYDDELSQDKLFEAFATLSQYNSQNHSVALYNDKFRKIT